MNNGKKKSGRGHLVSFMSAESQNKLIHLTANKLLKAKVDEIKQAEYARLQLPVQ